MNTTKTANQIRLETPLVPPKRFLRFAYNHWVQRLDYDGHACGLEVYQWQPNAQKWCLPNQYACGSDKDLCGYVWMGICPTPAHTQETDEILALLKTIKNQNDVICPEQLAKISQFIHDYACMKKHNSPSLF